ncbi:hypothetical protein [Algoriphagus yeomjeoni]|uniref:Uncharacterized protein n=1 Tax=Algoriphagus yeomjeoni TaxID=291403 RepID=A0A327NWE1_9BACT|nr:hypothetical protein [Algoriphagus yeomjeoni]RAI84398.1 hypothetical protein LV83_04021 [Algoriphagus yeomjeoni]
MKFFFKITCVLWGITFNNYLDADQQAISSFSHFRQVAPKITQTCDVSEQSLGYTVTYLLSSTNETF